MKLNHNETQQHGDTHHKHLILGAGFVGLGMAQALKEAGIPYFPKKKLKLKQKLLCSQEMERRSVLEEI